MPSYVVYVDQVFIGSLVMNLMILWVTARLGRVSYNRWRLLAGAAAGGLYSLVLFIPALEQYMGPGYKLLVSLLMVTAAFAPVPPKKFIVLLAYFYLSTFALGGTVLGIVNFLRRSVPGDRLSGAMQAVDAYLWYGLLVALIIFWSIGRIAPAVLGKRLVLPLLQADLDICLGGRRASLAALLDTGNSLTDPLTGNPVIIAEYESLKELLPERARRAIDAHGLENGATVLGEMGEGIQEGHFRIIPYRSVGRSNGWLIGFRPDEVIIRQRGNMVKTDQVVVALCPERLRGDAPCGALLPPDLLETGVAR
jgi:stage II sporulation protein GA (sporulation sigma-E factor processing peptidase)